MFDYPDLVRRLWRIKADDTVADDRYRAYLRLNGLPFVPFGEGNGKTEAPGTTRPVRKSCPSGCPYLDNGCFGQSGPIHLAERRASSDAHAGAVSAAVVLVWSARTGRSAARINVVGDFGKDDRVDHEYVHALATIAAEVRKLRGTEDPWVGWAYTHFGDGPWVELLREAGIAVRLSDRGGTWGAVVVRDREHARQRRSETGEKLAVCPAQLADNVSCVGSAKSLGCTLCWSRPDVTIAFIPHGSGARKVREAVST